MLSTDTFRAGFTEARGKAPQAADTPLPELCLSQSFPSKDGEASREGEEEKRHRTLHYFS